MFALFNFTVYATAEEDIVATVNGHDITLTEFRRSLLETRAAVFGYFQHRYGVDAGTRQFWSSSYDGEVPLEKLRKLTLDASVQIKVQQLLAFEKGLVGDVGYAAFLRRLDQENGRRKEAIRNHDVIYGPIEYSESTGFAHYFSLLVARLKRRLADDDFEITTATLRNFYEANKQQFKHPDCVMLHGLRARGTDAEEILRRLADQLREGAAPTEAMQDEQIGLIYFKQTVGDPASLGELSERFTLPNEVRDLPVGAVDLFEQESELFLIQSLARREMGHHPFDDRLVPLLKRRYIDAAYQQLIAKRVSEAEVIVNERVYSRILED